MNPFYRVVVKINNIKLQDFVMQKCNNFHSSQNIYQKFMELLFLDLDIKNQIKYNHHAKVANVKINGPIFRILD